MPGSLLLSAVDLHLFEGVEPLQNEQQDVGPTSRLAGLPEVPGDGPAPPAADCQAAAIRRSRASPAPYFAASPAITHAANP